MARQGVEQSQLPDADDQIEENSDLLMPVEPSQPGKAQVKFTDLEDEAAGKDVPYEDFGTWYGEIPIWKR